MGAAARSFGSSGLSLNLSLSLRTSPGYTRRARALGPEDPEDLIYMDTFPDLGSLTDQELKELIKQLTDEEMEISYRRRILHGKIDILRAELVNRLRKKDETGELVITGADVQQLTDILAGRVPGSESE
jgi:RsiG-like